MKTARLCFSLVWLDLIWFGSFPSLKKKNWENTGGGKSSKEKDLASKRPSGQKTSGEKT